MLDRGDLFIIRVVLTQWLAEHAEDPNASQVREVLRKVESTENGSRSMAKSKDTRA